MQLHFGKLFQDETKNQAPEDTGTTHSETVPVSELRKSQEFKEYQGFKEILLPSPLLDLSFRDAIQQQKFTHTLSNAPVTLQELSNVLFFSCGSVQKALDRNLSRRAQISIGGTYPLEVYVINFIEGDLEKRVYHYRPEEHSLDELWKLDFFKKEKIDRLFSDSRTDQFSCAVVITSVVDRIVPLYGDRAYRYMYLEAGAIANTLTSIGNTQDLHCALYENFYDTDLEEILDIDGEFETILTSIVLKK